MQVKKRVGVLRGGVGNGYESSIKTGAHVLKHLPSKLEPVEIFIARDGVWHVGGVPVRLSQIPYLVDVVFNALSGSPAEEGFIQRALSDFGVLFTGPTKSISAITRAKHVVKQILKRHHLKTPKGIVISKEHNLADSIHHVFNTMAPPWVVKPAREGGSIGVSIARSIRELEGALRHALFYDTEALLEEYVRGKEVAIFVVEGSDRWHTLPPVLIEKPPFSILDREAKNQGLYHLIEPLRFSIDEQWMLENTAKEVARALALRHYAKIDCVVHPKEGVTVLEVNTLPWLHAVSPLHPALSSAHISFSDFLDHIITKSLT